MPGFLDSIRENPGWADSRINVLKDCFKAVYKYVDKTFGINGFTGLPAGFQPSSGRKDR